MRVLLVIIAALCLTDCQSSSHSALPVLAIPEQISYDNELELAQISNQLSQSKLDELTRIKLLYRRGTLYDSLGFHTFARSDFMTILAMVPTIPGVYNYLGVIAAGQDDADSALLAFNTVIELDPHDDFVRLNRAILLYNMKRFDAAREDALAFYQQAPRDAFRILWLYLIESAVDENQAKISLQQRYDAISDHSAFSDNIVAFYLKRINEQDLIQKAQAASSNNLELAQRLCEVYFYLGKYYLNKGDEKRAEVMFKYALSSNIYNFIEHQQALFELNLLTENKVKLGSIN
ncbi:lipoprotein NlpI [Utexia brackfieldae]|uniref:lipoprotein NlpI n=1 Tax=Utexia brackfieldae TaxID=3074108 RepID=UPI00370D528B